MRNKRKQRHKRGVGCALIQEHPHENNDSYSHWDWHTNMVNREGRQRHYSNQHDGPDRITPLMSTSNELVTRKEGTDTPSGILIAVMQQQSRKFTRCHIPIDIKRPVSLLKGCDDFPRMST